LAVAIRRAMETATSIPQPLEQSLSTERPLVENAQGRAKDLMAKLEIDLISALGATLRFNPSDGD
jgi:predicted lipoprotein